ncbi:hypothetical protein [Williamsoniiplasma luminosum]|uniref:Uncharacterized protein n=1 Tax=Williamsoniiplasma luminosum TaxID=214888 RepID=A0A2S0NJ86_9MOLU|nr:hypothetical protein [Williamsoniiplasma luminosum]AVP49062.1 MAG: hypothetical protein C5T88_00480 [Williamsoniiplasma luminosum]
MKKLLKLLAIIATASPIVMTVSCQKTKTQTTKPINAIENLKRRIERKSISDIQIRNVVFVNNTLEAIYNKIQTEILKVRPGVVKDKDYTISKTVDADKVLFTVAATSVSELISNEFSFEVAKEDISLADIKDLYFDTYETELETKIQTEISTYFCAEAQKDIDYQIIKQMTENAGTIEVKAISTSNFLKNSFTINVLPAKTNISTITIENVIVGQNIDQLVLTKIQEKVPDAKSDDFTISGTNYANRIATSAGINTIRVEANPDSILIQGAFSITIEKASIEDLELAILVGEEQETVEDYIQTEMDKIAPGIEKDVDYAITNLADVTISGQTITVEAKANSTKIKDSFSITVEKVSIQEIELIVYTDDEEDYVKTYIQENIQVYADEAEEGTDYTISNLNSLTIAGSEITVSAIEDSALIKDSFTITVLPARITISTLSITDVFVGDNIGEAILRTIQTASPRATVNDFAITGSISETGIATTAGDEIITVRAKENSTLITDEFKISVAKKDISDLGATIINIDGNDFTIRRLLLEAINQALPNVGVTSDDIDIAWPRWAWNTETRVTAKTTSTKIIGTFIFQYI